MYGGGDERSSARPGETAEALLRRIDEVTREVHRVHEERAAEPMREARMRFASAHRVKRLVQRLEASRRGASPG